MTSDWRGLARGAKPKRSKSQRGMEACIISTAQQASPNVIHISEPVRAQLMRSSVVVTRKPLSASCAETSLKEPATEVASPGPRRSSVLRSEEHTSKLQSLRQHVCI